MGSIAIVGAGVAGLTAAHALAAKGHSVTVVDRNSQPGGLARSFHYGGERFDVGPHRFHTDNARVARYIRDVLAGEAIEIPRKSAVRMFGRFHEWPLRPSILPSMPLSLMVAGARDLLFRSHRDGDSFAADVVNKYGRTLYGIFFKPYTEKFLFHSPEQLHKDWGRAGVNRAVIDKRVKADTLWTLLKGTLLPRPVETCFLYPSEGVGRYSDRLVEKIGRLGGRVLLGRAVNGVEVHDRRVRAVIAGDERFTCDTLLWTAPLTVLSRHLGIVEPNLRFLSTILYNIVLNRPVALDYQWIYFGGDELFSRVSIPTVFSPAMARPGKGTLCVELTCFEGDERWQAPDRFTEPVVADLERAQAIASAGEVERVHIERVPDTYPVYTLDYHAELARALRDLETYPNLVLLGRSGRFWYNNMDHSIGQALTVAERVDRGVRVSEADLADREFWQDTPANHVSGA